MSPDKICSNIFFFNLDNLERREKEKKEQKLRVINKFRYIQREENIEHFKNTKRRNRIYLYMVWYSLVSYLREQGKFDLEKKGRGGELRSNRYKEESFPRTKSILSLLLLLLLPSKM